MADITTGIETTQPAINSLTGQAVAPQPTSVSSLTYTPPTAAQVYSPQNVASTVTSPVQAPNLSDPYNLYDQFMKSPDITNAQNEVTGLTNELNTLRQNTRNQVQGIGNLPENLNVLRGFQREASDAGALKEQAIGENLNAKIAYLNTLKEDAQNKYNIAQQERSQIKELIAATYGKAGISYTDSYESALQKVKKWEKKEEKKAEKKAKKEAKKADKKELIRELMKYGINTDGMTSKQIRKAYVKYFADKAAEAKKASQVTSADSIWGGSEGGTVTNDVLANW